MSTRDIVEQCKAIGLKDPEFIQEEDFKVILWRKDKQDEAINNALKFSENANNEHIKIYNLISEAINEALNDAIKEELCKVVELIYKQPGINRPELIDRAEKSKASIERYLKILKENNLIDYKGSKKTGGYYLTENINNILSK